jgi:hypothetical protein
MKVKVRIEHSPDDWIWRRVDEEFHPDCIDYEKRATSTGMMFLFFFFLWGGGGGE